MLQIWWTSTHKHFEQLVSRYLLAAVMLWLIRSQSCLLWNQCPQSASWHSLCHARFIKVVKLHWSHAPFVTSVLMSTLCTAHVMLLAYSNVSCYLHARVLLLLVNAQSQLCLVSKEYLEHCKACVMLLARSSHVVGENSAWFETNVYRTTVGTACLNAISSIVDVIHQSHAQLKANSHTSTLWTACVMLLARSSGVVAYQVAVMLTVKALSIEQQLAQLVSRYLHLAVLLLLCYITLALKPTSHINTLKSLCHAVCMQMWVMLLARRSSVVVHQFTIMQDLEQMSIKQQLTQILSCYLRLAVLLLLCYI